MNPPTDQTPDTGVPMGKIVMDESVDLLVAQKLKEYNELRYRVGDRAEDYLEGVYEIYDILRENGAKL